MQDMDKTPVKWFLFLSTQKITIVQQRLNSLLIGTVLMILIDHLRVAVTALGDNYDNISHAELT